MATADQPKSPSAQAQPNLAYALAEALALHQQGQLPEAERRYAAILAIKPDHADALHFLGLIKFAEGQPAEALRLIAAAMHAARSPQMFLNYGIVLNSLNRNEEAVDSFGRAVELAPDFLDAHNSRGVLLDALGRHQEAIESYRRALALAPNSAAIVYNLGNALNASGRREEALAAYDRTVALQPDHAEALCNRGTILQALGRLDEALASYDRALASRPDIPEAHCNRGNALIELKRHEDALTSLDRALALRPDYVEAHLNRGNAFNALKRHAEALESFDRALALKPDHVEALCNRGVALQGLGRIPDALASYDRALALRPDVAETHSNRGNALLALQRYDEALASFDRALALQPNSADPHSNRGIVLTALARHDEALASFDRALALAPDHVEALSNKSAVLLELKQYDEALACADRALALAPDHVGALCNRGTILNELMRQGEALAAFDRAIEIAPEAPKLHWNAGAVSLLTGDFARGWAEYEWRWKKDSMAKAMRSFPQPLWLGEGDIAGKTILLHSEQGFGDTLQFCRYAAQVAARGARVILEVEAPLTALMSTLAGPAQVIAKGSALPDFDLHCPLLSLPLAFGTRPDTIPAETAYLKAPSSHRWRDRLAAVRRPAIGLVWSGNPAHHRDAERSASLAALEPSLDAEATFVSLQKEPRPADAALLAQRPEILRFGEQLGDFSDTAALIAALDLVIAVDTSVAHLAAALGKPAWILLQYLPDWRWMLHREDSPWYPTARLFRQNETRRWDAVVARVRTALDEFLRAPAR